MNVEVPDDIVRRAEANAGDLLAALAVQLYADNRIDFGDACRLSGLNETTLAKELLKRQIVVQQYPQRHAG